MQDRNWLFCFSNFWTARGESLAHSREQATGASRVVRALHPQQAQEGTESRREQRGGQSPCPRTSSPSSSARPLCARLHQDSFFFPPGIIVRGWGTGGTTGSTSAAERCGHPGQGARKGEQRGNLSPWRGSFSRAVYTKGEAWGAAQWLCHVLLVHLPLYAQQDLNRLFCLFQQLLELWNLGLPFSGGPWRSRFFGDLRRGGWYFWDVGCRPDTHFHPLLVLWRWRLGNHTRTIAVMPH